MLNVVKGKGECLFKACSHTAAQVNVVKLSTCTLKMCLSKRTKSLSSF